MTDPITTGRLRELAQQFDRNATRGIGSFHQNWLRIQQNEDIASALRELIERREREPCVMWLCEANAVVLKPDKLYRFEVDPDCNMCRAATDPWRGVRKVRRNG